MLALSEPTNGYDLTLRIQATSETGRRTKVYSLTAAGRRHLAKQRADWQQFSGALTAILRVT